MLYFADVLHLIKSGKCDADAGLYYIQLQVYSLGLRPISSINVAFVFNDFWDTKYDTSSDVKISNFYTVTLFWQNLNSLVLGAGLAQSMIPG